MLGNFNQPETAGKCSLARHGGLMTQRDGMVGTNESLPANLGALDVRKAPLPVREVFFHTRHEYFHERILYHMLGEWS